MRKVSFVLFFSVAFLPFAIAQYCPGCVIDYSYLSPGVYPVTLPVATAGEYYEADLTFVLQEDTTVDIVGTLEFLNYYIMEPLGMPYGLHASSDLGDFPVNYDPDVSLYGCVKVCGTPLIAGFYSVTVPLIATLESPAGDIPAEYELTLEVLPPSGTSGGFSTSIPFGCSPLNVVFETSYPSDGVDGFSYFWDFGNGFTSVDENPSPQMYEALDVPVDYIISHTVSIDTVGYSLDYISIINSSCDDCTIFGCTGLTTAEKPDLYFTIDALAVNTFPGYADTDPPVTNILNVEVDPLTSYFIAVKDDDAGPTGDDDNCGAGYFDGGDVGVTTIDIGASTIEVSISHPVITYTFYDTITVYPNPTVPLISVSEETIFCTGDSVILSTPFVDEISYQWYAGSDPIVGANTNSYTAYSSGSYHLNATAVGGCIATSASTDVTVYDYPSGLVAIVIGNTLNTSSDDALQWYYAGSAIPGATSEIYYPAIEGIYSVCATNEICTVCSPEVAFVFQSIENFSAYAMHLFPNPGNGIFTIESDFMRNEFLYLEIKNQLGEIVLSESILFQQSYQFDLTKYTAGIYTLLLQGENFKSAEKIIKQ